MVVLNPAQLEIQAKNVENRAMTASLPLILIGGPTASGKSALALTWARRTNGCIINADAMQVYRGLPLLTAQPSVEEKAIAPHRLYEILSPTEKFSVARWLEQAEAAIDETISNQRTPIVVGGTGLYFKALCTGLATIPAIPDATHAEAVALYHDLGEPAFRTRLAAADPQAAARLKPNDRQRLIRAMEVVLATGRPLTAWQNDPPPTPPVAARFALRPFLVLPPRPALYAACEARFRQMIERGALSEVDTLISLAPPADSPALKILGVPELMAFRQGALSLDEAVAKAQQATRNYAKRQVTWFKNQWRCTETFPVETLQN
jgi:tRNA dimethylallyltransferase